METFEEDDLNNPREMFKLVDGARDKVGSPLIFFYRKKLQKGKYILFYRAAFNTTDEEEKDKIYKGGKLAKGTSYVHQSQKLVVSI